jgi:Zn-dependent protease
MFSGIDYQYILNIVTSVVIVLVATVFHELAHAATANALGDPTAKERGRLTLNPFAHLDPVGSVVLPILMALAGGPIFAFAKPVPYNPHRLRHPIRDEVLVALAGPFANLIQALLGAGIFHLFMGVYDSGQMDAAIAIQILQVLASYTYLNLMLMFFNLIPLPPLDGSAIISPLLRGRAREAYYQVQRYSMPVLLAIMFLVPMVFHVDPLGIYLRATAGRAADLILSI